MSICIILVIACIIATMSILIIIPQPISAHSGDNIDCKYGTPPTIDGSISQGEWDDANFVQYSISDDAIATVYFKEDGETLYVAFDIPTPEHDYDDSGILFDTNNDGGDNPKRDDIVIQQRRDGSEKREGRGTGISWLYIPSTAWGEETSTSETGWQIEYRIDFSKLYINADEAKTIGIGFHILDDSREYDWPVNPCFNNPDSWADMSSSDDWGIIENQPPTASADANPTNGTEPLIVSFTGTGTDNDGLIIAYHWDFDDGATSDEQNPIHTFQNAGTYNVQLTVRDNGNATATDTVIIDVTEQPTDGEEPPDDQDDNEEPPDDATGEEKGSEESSEFIPGFELILLLFGLSITILILGKRRKEL